MSKKKFNLSEITKSKIFWAVVAELLILLVCLIIRPDFFKISYQPATGMLYGSLIDRRAGSCCRCDRAEVSPLGRAGV